MQINNGTDLNLFSRYNWKKSRPPKSYRIMINAILWVLRTGSSWRNLPSKYGSRIIVYTRVSRCFNSVLWDEIFLHISKNSKSEYKYD